MRKLLAGLLISLFLSSYSHALQIAVGSYVGNGLDSQDVCWNSEAGCEITATNTNSAPTFQPDFVLIKGDLAAQGWILKTASMVGDLACTINTGTDCVTDRIQALNTTGFQIGANAQTNTNTTTYHFIAIKDNGQTDFTVGDYTVTASPADDRNIDISDTSDTASADFLPGMVFVKCNSANAGVWNTTDMGANSTSGFSQEADQGNAIQLLASTGFQLGTDSQVQDASTTCYYAAFKDVSTYTKSDNYTGNSAVDNNQVTTVGFQPIFMFIKGASATSTAAYRFGSNSGDSSYAGSNATAADRIQNFLSNGFEYGTSNPVNETSVDMQWWALGQPPATGRRTIILGNLIQQMNRRNV